MSSAEVNEKDQALIMVHLRNTFYKKKFHLALLIYFFSLLVIVFLSCVLYFLVKNPTHPLYFVTDKVGRLIKDVPRTVPNMTNEEVEQWAIEALETAYSYNFVNYREQLQNAQKYFTEYGWRNYMKSLDASSNLLALTQRKYIITAKVINKPKLLVEGMLGGAYSWKFQMPLLVNYLIPPFDTNNPKSSFQNALIVTLVVQRQSILTSYKGLGVLQLIATMASQTI